MAEEIGIGIRGGKDGLPAGQAGDRRGGGMILGFGLCAGKLHHGASYYHGSVCQICCCVHSGATMKIGQYLLDIYVQHVHIYRIYIFGAVRRSL